jgi:dTDP-glucose 4,6-dehydratase
VYGIPRAPLCGEDHPTVPLGAYGRSKLLAEGLCSEAVARGLDVTMLRPMSLFGPWMTGIFAILFEWVRTGKPVYMLGRGANRVQGVSAWDVADALLLAGERPGLGGRVFNLGAEPEGVPSVFEWVRALVRHGGDRSPVLRIPAAALRGAARALGLFGLSPIVPEHYILADRNFVLDTSAARRDLGWKPRYDNVRMLCEAYDWYASLDAPSRPPLHPVVRLLNAISPGFS